MFPLTQDLWFATTQTSFCVPPSRSVQHGISRQCSYCGRFVGQTATRQLACAASFVGLLLTQLLTATNDNVFRWLVIGIGKDYYPDNVSAVLTAGSACFLLPYLLLAAPAGYLADRFSKRTVIVACKVAEVIIMVLGIGAILLGSPIVLFVVVALMGAQSGSLLAVQIGQYPRDAEVRENFCRERSDWANDRHLYGCRHCRGARAQRRHW